MSFLKVNNRWLIHKLNEINWQTFTLNTNISAKNHTSLLQNSKKDQIKKCFKVMKVEHIHTHINGRHEMDKKSNFGLNLQKWVCLRNTKFWSLHILSPLKNTNPSPLPWNTYYYVDIFTIFDCKQTNMVVSCFLTYLNPYEFSKLWVQAHTTGSEKRSAVKGFIKL